MPLKFIYLLSVYCCCFVWQMYYLQVWTDHQLFSFAVCGCFYYPCERLPWDETLTILHFTVSRSWETIATSQHVLSDVQKASQCPLCVRQPERSRERSTLMEPSETQQEPVVTHQVIERLWMITNYPCYRGPSLCHPKNRRVWRREDVRSDPKNLTE